MAMPRRSIRSDEKHKEKHRHKVQKRKEEESLIHEEDDEEVNDNDAFIDNEFDEPDRANISSSPLSNSSPRFNRSLSSSTDSFKTVRSEFESKRRNISKNPNKTALSLNDTGEHINDLREDVTSRRSRPKRYGLIRILAITVVFSILLLICAALYLRLSSKSGDTRSPTVEKSLQDVYAELKNGLKILKQDFQQTRHLWVQLMWAISSIMENKPQRPAVILTLVPTDARRTSVCLLHNIAQITSDAFQDRRQILVDVKSLSENSNALKKDLHSSLNLLDQSHVAVIHNIEKIPGDAAMVFHSFCDTDNAPHKRALYFLTLEVESNYSSIANTDDKLQNTVDQHLRDIWTGPIRDVDVAAIITRIANSPILVKPESLDTLESYCSV